MSEQRPDPDALLRRVTAEEQKHRRGRLKIFFGASPGVGKTYAMLEAAQRQRAEGRDVLIGWVETHGRPETAALTEGLERLPPQTLEYRGSSLREFDLAGALARKPELLLLDELAHSNAPGATHAKRWQDTQELLQAGIHVWTTLNVQHLESLNDLVAQVTEVRVRETVPDAVLDRADEIEFVDLPAEELLQRLAQGKVYVADQAARAVEHFFRKGNLYALRELALRRTAERVDADVQEYRRDHEIETTWPVAERVLVCVRPNPESDRLVRAARRLADRLRAGWIVAFVETPSQPPLSAQEREILARTTKLTEQLGGEVAVLAGENVAAALLACARERNVSKIVVGKPTHPRWRDRLRGSLVDAIVRGSGEIDVYIISGEHDEARRAPAPRPARRSPARRYAWATAVMALSTTVCWGMHGRFDRANLIMVYLLGVAFVATRLGRGPSALATCLGVAAFDFFFVPPHLTFAVSDTQYVVTFTVMLVVGLLISSLAVQVRDQAQAALQREQRTQALYAMSRELAALRSPEEVAGVAARHVGELFRGPATVLLPGPDGALASVPVGDASLAAEPRERAVAEWAFEHGHPSGLGTDTLPGASALFLPLRGGQGLVGVLGLRAHESLRPLSRGHWDLLEALAHQLESALDRARLASESEAARLSAESERLRNTLLSSVSHDLRTPLSAISGAAETLRAGASVPEELRAELAATIHEEAERLNRLVGNLLDMTRLESGTLQLRKEWHSFEELVGSALNRLARRLAGRPVAASLPDDLPLVPMDAALVEQVLVNLVENALKYTPAGTPILISAWRDEAGVTVEVADEGPGLPPGAEERVFDKFQRDGAAGQAGFGLGLAICRAIVSAHGGRVWAESHAPRGAAFRFTLPVHGTPSPAPELPVEPD